MTTTYPSIRVTQLETDHNPNVITAHGWAVIERSEGDYTDYVFSATLFPGDVRYITLSTSNGRPVYVPGFENDERKGDTPIGAVFTAIEQAIEASHVYDGHGCCNCGAALPQDDQIDA